MPLYPDGYTDFSPRLTMAQIIAKHGVKMENEYCQRLFSMIEAAKGLVGIGGGWRLTQPNKPGFAPDGKSFHQTQSWKDGTLGYAAVDTIGVNGRHQDAWHWIHVNAPQFGLTDFSAVNNEPWHVQSRDIPLGWQSWVNAGRPNPNPRYALPPIVIPPAPPEVSTVFERCEMLAPSANNRWDTRGFGAAIPAGQYGIAFAGSLGKKGVKGNLIITSPALPGYATAWAGDTPAPPLSDINFYPGIDISNQIDVPLAADGTFKVFISQPAHITFDLKGFWT